MSTGINDSLKVDDENSMDISGDKEDEQQPLAPKPAAPATVLMPAVGHTLEFPRRDNAYKKKESLPYDEFYSNVWKNRPANPALEEPKKWLVFVLAGVAIGITGFCMVQLEDFLVEANRGLLEDLILDFQDDSALRFWLPALSYACVCALLGLLAGLMTTYYGPGATGSGVAELIGYMNGVNYPEFLGVNTLITKILGVVLAVGSHLCIGKEGPLAHIGAIWGAAAVYTPALGLEFLQHDEFKRQIIAAGGSAGVSAAFGAPIGGTLFAYEMSKPTVFWTFEMIWKTFVCCSVAVLVLAVLSTFASGASTDGFRGSTIKFGGQLANDKYENTWQVMPAAIGIGIVGGLLGAFFININFRMNAFRKKWLTAAYMKPLETAAWSFASGFVFIAVPYILYIGNDQVCQPRPTDHEAAEITYRGWCPEGMIDPNASVFWASEGEVIRNIMNAAVPIFVGNLVVFLAVWYFFTITTYGTNVPAGLFLPGMIIGCALGHSLFSLVEWWGWIDISDDPEKHENEKIALTRSYTVLACGAFMAGYTRMTYSLAVILMETTQDIEIFTPMIVTIAVGNQVGYFFTRSLYERATRSKQMPIIKDFVPAPCEAVIASQIMSREVVTLQNVETVQNVLRALKTPHHGFPIRNSRGHVVGLIPKNYILTLLEQRAFYRVDGEVEDDEEDDHTGMKDKSLSAHGRSSSAAGYVKTQTFKMQRKGTFSEYSNQEDAEKYPETPSHLIVPWKHFCRDFWSNDKKLTRDLKALCEYHDNYMLDFRPYLIESPVTVFTTDSLKNCVELCRNMYLRHIIVLSPIDGKLSGIITRQDLFAWLDL